MTHVLFKAWMLYLRRAILCEAFISVGRRLPTYVTLDSSVGALFKDLIAYVLCIICRRICPKFNMPDATFIDVLGVSSIWRWYTFTYET